MKNGKSVTGNEIQPVIFLSLNEFELNCSIRDNEDYKEESPQQMLVKNLKNHSVQLLDLKESIVYKERKVDEVHSIKDD